MDPAGTTADPASHNGSGVDHGRSSGYGGGGGGGGGGEGGSPLVLSIR